MKTNRKLFISFFICAMLVISTVISGCSLFQSKAPITLDSIPEFSNSPYVVINNNEPFFTSQDMTTTSFERYSPLDLLGRCGEAYACIGQDIMPTEDRKDISSVTPSGWQKSYYDFVDGKYLYNRCHLIGFQLAGENANELNLITGTRYMNVDGMLPFENMIADYVKETDNHVLYRVTPIYSGNNLVANGVLMEAISVEDNGDGICFNVYVYNNQPGVIINYSDGTNRAANGITQSPSPSSTLLPSPTAVPSFSPAPEQTYILNTNTKKFHYPSCSSAADTKPENKSEFTGSRDELIANNYLPCGRCDP